MSKYQPVINQNQKQTKLTQRKAKVSKPNNTNVTNRPQKANSKIQSL